MHWVYGPHTTDGVVGKDNPLLLASNFSGTWPGLVGLLNTGACLESVEPAVLAGLDRRAETGQRDDAFMERLDEWCTTGRIVYGEDEVATHAPVDAGRGRSARRAGRATASSSGARSR